MKIEIKSLDMMNAVIKDLLYAHECDHITRSLPIRKLEEHKSERPKTINSGIFEIRDWTDIRVMKKYVLYCIFLHCIAYKKTIYETFNIFKYSIQVDETKDIIYDKLSRRIAHVTGLKANSSRGESEEMLVIYLITFIMLL